MLKTIDVLSKYGYFNDIIRDSDGKEYEREYKDKVFKLTAHVYPTWNHNLSMIPVFKSFRYAKYIKGELCIEIGGIYRTSKSIGMLEFLMPAEFETERDCLAWFFLCLAGKLGKADWEDYCRYKNISFKFYKSDMLVLPRFIEEKERKKEAVLTYAKNLDLLHFDISREELVRLRKLVSDHKNEKAEKLTEVKIYFDGDFVTWKAKEYKFAGAATGIEWPNPITITYNHEWCLPSRLSRGDHRLTFCEDGLIICGSLNREVKVTGNTVGKTDVFDAGLLARLLSLSYFYPRYDWVQYKKFDEDDFKEWIVQELDLSVNPYLDCLSAMIAPFPIQYEDYKNNYISLNKIVMAIEFFRKYPKDANLADMYVDWEKIFPFKEDLVLFSRIKPGWECWRNQTDPIE